MVGVTSEVVVVDYGAGNLKSVQRGFEKISAGVTLASTPEAIAAASHLVLPGVGAFEDGVGGLQRLGLWDAIQEFVGSGKPLLGICLGMQMLMDESEEHGRHQGLGLIGGRVVAIPKGDGDRVVRKIPHIGWSALRLPSELPQGSDGWAGSCFSATRPGDFFYFVHSFMAVPDSAADLLAQCEYEGQLVTAAIRRENVTGLQFHPEKSGESGLTILKEFVAQ